MFGGKESEIIGVETESRAEKLEKLIEARFEIIAGCIPSAIKIDGQTSGQFNVELELNDDEDEIDFSSGISADEIDRINQVLAKRCEEDSMDMKLELTSIENSDDQGKIGLYFNYAPSGENVEAEQSVEKRLIRFTNKCAHCGEEVSTEKEVPISMAGKIKKMKDGRKYRDWDYGLVPCKCLNSANEPREVFVFFRELID